MRRMFVSNVRMTILLNHWRWSFDVSRMGEIGEWEQNESGVLSAAMLESGINILGTSSVPFRVEFMISDHIGHVWDEVWALLRRNMEHIGLQYDFIDYEEILVVDIYLVSLLSSSGPSRVIAVEAHLRMIPRPEMICFRFFRNESVSCFECVHFAVYCASVFRLIRILHLPSPSHRALCTLQAMPYQQFDTFHVHDTNCND